MRAPARVIAALRSISLTSFTLWISFVMSSFGSVAMLNLWRGGDSRFGVGVVVGVAVAIASAREIIGQRRAEVPLIVGTAALVAIWFTVDDPVFRATFMIELAVLPVAIVILRPTTWRVAFVGVLALFSAMAAFDVLVRDRTFVDVFLRIGIVGVMSAALIELIRRIDDQRRAAQARAVGIVNTTRIATVALNYRDVVAQFARLRSFGVQEIRTLLTGDNVLAFADLVEVVASNEAAEVLRLAEHAPSFADRTDSQLDATRAELTTLWNGETWVQHEFPYERRDGTSGWVRQDWAAPIVDGRPDYELVVLTTVEITKLKEAEAAKAREVEARDQFIASVSHELRTPLTGVVGLSSELKERGSTFDPVEARELMELIADQSQDVANIVEDLLVEARLGQGNIRVSPARIRVKDVLSIVPGDVDVQIHPDELDVFADGDRVRQILRNLLTNAARYGGAEVRVAAYARDGATVIDVLDDGEPIPQSKRSAIFEPYQRAGEARGVTAAVGLGLTVSRGLAELMDGTLEYVYEDQSIFRLTLPPGTDSTIVVDDRHDRVDDVTLESMEVEHR